MTMRMGPRAVTFTGGSGGGGGGGQTDWLGPLTMDPAAFVQASAQDPGANMGSIQIAGVEAEGSTWLRLDSRRDAGGAVLANGVRIQGVLTDIAAGDFVMGGDIVLQFIDNATGKPTGPAGSLSGLYGGPVYVDGADAETAAYVTQTIGPNASSPTNMALFPEKHTGFDTQITGPLASDGDLMEGRERFFFAFERIGTTLRLYLWGKEGCPKLVGSETVTAGAGQVGYRIESWNANTLRCVAHLRFASGVTLPWQGA